jgi:hypothetical protein
MMTSLGSGHGWNCAPRIRPPSCAPRSDAGLPEVKHPGHPYYVMAPGGQVFTIAPLHWTKVTANALTSLAESARNRTRPCHSD